jgi:hypothetical protein
MKKMKKINSLLLIAVTMQLILTGCSFFGGGKKNIIAFRETKEDAWGLMKEDGTVITKSEWDYKSFEPVAICGDKILLKHENEKKVTYEFFTIEEKPKQVGKNYIWANPFTEGLAGVTEENGKIDFVDEKMEKVFSVNDVDGFSIEKATTFKNGFARIINENEEYGFINNKGEVIVKPKYSYISEFSDNGYALCVKNPNNQRIGEINEMIIAAIADSIAFAESIQSQTAIGSNSAEVQSKLKKIEEELKGNRKSFKEENVNSLIIVDKEGKTIFEKKWFAEDLFSVDYNQFSNKGFFPYSDNKDGNWGIMNFNGDKVVKANSKFKGFDRVLDNYAIYKNEEGKYGILDLDKEGEIKIRAKYDKMYFGDNTEKIFVRVAKKMKVIDIEDNEILKDEFDEIVTENLKHYLVQEGEKWTFVNKDGKNETKTDYFDVKLTTEKSFSKMLVQSDYFNASEFTSKLTTGIAETKYLEFDLNGTNPQEIANKFKLKTPEPNYYGISNSQNIDKYSNDKNYTISVSLRYNDQIIKQKTKMMSLGDYTTEVADGFELLNNKLMMASVDVNIKSNNNKASQKLKEIMDEVKKSFETKGFKKIDENTFENSKTRVNFSDSSISFAFISSISNDLYSGFGGEIYGD